MEANVMTDKHQVQPNLPTRMCRLTRASIKTGTRLVLLFMLLGLALPVLYAQVDQGTITGVITDTTGAVIPKASIEVQNVGTARKIHANADANGVYTLPPLQVGTY